MRTGSKNIRAKSGGETGPERGPQAGADGPPPAPGQAFSAQYRGGLGSLHCQQQACRGKRAATSPDPQPPHQQQLVALPEASLLGQGARLDEVDEAPAGVAPEQAELGDETVAAECGVLHRETGTPHVPHGCDRRPEGSGAGEKRGVRQLWSGPPAGTPSGGASHRSRHLRRNWRASPTMTAQTRNRGPGDTAAVSLASHAPWLCARRV